MARQTARQDPAKLQYPAKVASSKFKFFIVDGVKGVAREMTGCP